jgi:hypothetical protein
MAGGVVQGPPGRYRVQYEVRLLAHPGATPSGWTWVAQLLSGPVTIDVKPAPVASAPLNRERVVLPDVLIESVHVGAGGVITVTGVGGGMPAINQFADGLRNVAPGVRRPEIQEVKLLSTERTLVGDPRFPSDAYRIQLQITTTDPSRVLDLLRANQSTGFATVNEMDPSTSAGQARGEDGIAWGQAQGSLRLGLEIVSSTREFSAGDKLVPRLHIQNVGRETIEVSVMATRLDTVARHGADDREILITARDSGVLGDVNLLHQTIEPGAYGGVTFINGVILGGAGAAASEEERKLFGPAVVANLTPGTYRLRYRFMDVTISIRRQVPGIMGMTRWSEWQPLREPTETGAVEFTVKPVAPFTIALNGQRMEEIVAMLRVSYGLPVHFEAVRGPGADGADAATISGVFTAPTMSALLERLTEGSAYRVERFGDSFVILPRGGSALEFPVTLDAQNIPSQEAVGKILLGASPDVGIRTTEGPHVPSDVWAMRLQMTGSLDVSRIEAWKALTQATELTPRDGGRLCWDLYYYVWAPGAEPTLRLTMVSSKHVSPNWNPTA